MCWFFTDSLDMARMNLLLSRNCSSVTNVLTITPRRRTLWNYMWYPFSCHCWLSSGDIVSVIWYGFCWWLCSVRRQRSKENGFRQNPESSFAQRYLISKFLINWHLEFYDGFSVGANMTYIPITDHRFRFESSFLEDLVDSNDFLSIIFIILTMDTYKNKFPGK